jgi:hypothetical protein
VYRAEFETVAGDDPMVKANENYKRLVKKSDTQPKFFRTTGEVRKWSYSVEVEVFPEGIRVKSDTFPKKK